jgi:solute carrier family 31 (copper transporter), member 1
MTSAEMAMVFFQSVTTPLYASAWTPSGQGSYAGTCIFLVTLATIHRILSAIQSIIFSTRSHGGSSRLGSDADEPESLKRAGRQLNSEWHSHRFRVADETARAVFEVITSGIGYLL